MTNINSVVTLVDILLKASKYEDAERLVNAKLQENAAIQEKLLELQKEISKQGQTRLHINQSSKRIPEVWYSILFFIHRRHKDIA